MEVVDRQMNVARRKSRFAALAMEWIQAIALRVSPSLAFPIVSATMKSPSHLVVTVRCVGESDWTVDNLELLQPVWLRGTLIRSSASNDRNILPLSPDGWHNRLCAGRIAIGIKLRSAMRFKNDGAQPPSIIELGFYLSGPASGRFLMRLNLRPDAAPHKLRRYQIKKDLKIANISSFELG
jgi:hypothetical protein